MAINEKISGDPSAAPLTGVELIAAVQSGGNVSLTPGQIQTLALTPTINPQSGTSYTLGTVTTDNDGKTYLRMTNSSANTVTIPSTQTLPISITQRGTGATTLVAGSGVTLNGTLTFSAQHQTKSIIPLGSGVFDVVG